ncbi:ubiquitin carboxyl- hydrolase 6 [Trichinella spiralis]|uniref:ubiquitin carboxyl- hydrolase 6 n=1 Tax=Trichinella spiralis TaxID=6334 RepID=UPI0001EFDBA4|nr:ubiquitin carboxyl- hydrolase 6 [Trichinella spiralis]
MSVSFRNDDVQPGESGEEEKVKRREIRREKKWLKLLRSWSQYQGTARVILCSAKRAHALAESKFRSEVWRRLLNIDGQKQIGLYDRLRLAARLRAKDTKQIDLDINRTYRNHVFFRQRYGFKQRSLLNVLTAYSMFNRELGYCQGMNHLAALLLMYFRCFLGIAHSDVRQHSRDAWFLCSRFSEAVALSTSPRQNCQSSFTSTEKSHGTVVNRNVLYNWLSFFGLISGKPRSACCALQYKMIGYEQSIN